MTGRADPSLPFQRRPPYSPGLAFMPSLPYRASLAFLLILLCQLPGTTRVAAAEDGGPEVLDERLRITLFAEQPAIVTPTGLDVDWLGRVWVLESNTHFPPDGYVRHPTDRLYVMRDADGDGRAEEVRIFADGFTHAMSVAVRRAADGSPRVLVATRAAILALGDADGDLRADRRQAIVRLETEGNYPHNGLAGFAFDALGWMYFGLGENLGAPYALVGSDGVRLEGGGEGGNLYRCRPDGSGLQRWATGFWNPHASCIDAFGRLFTVDNDPDSRPPCRLLHVVRDGDYGYRFRNGRKGLHPFTSWDGELPATLPMVAGTGEAPSGIVACESGGLPSDYRGDLLVTSWGDHRIDRFRLQPRGASFSATSQPMVRGGEDFRPVGLAIGPDGSLYCTDWVKRDYKLHGFGRVWKISARQPADSPPAINGPLSDPAAGADLPLHEARQRLQSPWLEVRRAAARNMARTAPGREQLLAILESSRERAESGQAGAASRASVEALWALARSAAGAEAATLEPAAGEAAGVEPATVEPATVEPAERSAIEDAKRAVEAALRGPRDELATAAARLRPAVLGIASCDLDEQQKQAIAAALPVTGAGPRAPRDDGLLLALLETWRPQDWRSVLPCLESQDPFLFAASVNCLAESLAVQPGGERTAILVGNGPDADLGSALSPRARLGLLLALRAAEAKSGDATLDAKSRRELLLGFLRDADPGVRRAAVQWVAEARIETVLPELESSLQSGSQTPDLFRATIAALQMLRGVAPQDIDKTPPAEYLVGIVRDERRPAAVRASALAMLPADEPLLTFELLQRLTESADPALRLEAARTLSWSSDPQREEWLRRAAGDASSDPRVRLEAVAGLGRFNDSQRPANQQVLVELLASPATAVRREALRSLRGYAAVDSRLRNQLAKLVDDADWRPLADEVKLAIGDPLETRSLADGLLAPADPASGSRPANGETGDTNPGDKNPGDKNPGDWEAGQRLFFHDQGPACGKCHTVRGRGAAIGPDLSFVARTMDRRKLAESILEPSREIAPQFTTWTFLLESGRQVQGVVLSEDVQRVRIGTVDGQQRELAVDQIDARRPQKISLMPADLSKRISAREFRDLLAYLESLK